MKLLRNPDVKKTITLYLSIGIITSVPAFIENIFFGCIISLLTIIFTLIYLFDTKKRYNDISKISEDIDKILHGNDRIFLNSYTEGDLGILQSEISKMTIRLREQQQTLNREKIYLANSLADISHQIRTPLTSINLLISMISKPNIDDVRRHELSCELYELISRIEWLIDSLLKISKLDAKTVKLTSRTIPLQTLLNKAVAPLLIPIELRDQTLTITAEGSFYGDLLWTAEAVSNIVKNCMEHTPPNGKISITASENTLYSEIIIFDNGKGISKEDLPHIFERFYKGKTSGDKGFGIGLALSRMIIVSQNGTVKAENITPHGAAFTIRFYKGTV